MPEYWSGKIIRAILLGLLALGVALLIWNAIPTFIKILAVIGAVLAFFKIITSK